MGGVETKGGVLVTPPPKLAQHLDWIEITYPIIGQNVNIEYPDWWTKARVETKPFNGYKIAVRYGDGRIEMVNPDQPSMGIHIVIPAQALQAIGGDDLATLEFFIANGAKITRLDCALDVFGKPLDFDELWKLAESGEFECRLRKVPMRTLDAAHGDTIYFGRMKSSVFTRIYNKAAEQNYSGDWVRIETVFRHSRANNAAKLMVKRKLDTSSLIRGHINLPRLQWWTDVMQVKAEKTRLNRSDGDKRREWLMKSVAPTLAKEMILDDSVYEEFKARVFDCLEAERQKSYKLSN